MFIESLLFPLAATALVLLGITLFGAASWTPICINAAIG
jgi:hypothetical protein